MSEEIYHGRDPTKNNVVYQSKHYYNLCVKLKQNTSSRER